MKVDPRTGFSVPEGAPVLSAGGGPSPLVAWSWAAWARVELIRIEATALDLPSIAVKQLVVYGTATVVVIGVARALGVRI